MNAYPFSIFKRADRACYSVSFKDADGKYLQPISTGKKTENEARDIAFAWLRDGIPQDKEELRVHHLSLKDVVRKIKTKEEADILLSELKRYGWVKSYVLNETPGSADFISFLKTFWDWDTSPYVKEKLRKSHGIHKRHCTIQKQAIVLYWEKFFIGRSLGDIKAEDIDAFINFMADKDVSFSRKNAVIKAGTKALRWAFSKGKIEHDPTRGHLLFSGEERKRNILSPSVAAALFRAEWYDERAKLGNMLAAVTGMRNGEILALRFQDLGNDRLFVQNSWNWEDLLKPTKNNDSRNVYIPFPDLMNGLIELAKQNPWGVSPESYVFWTEYRQDRPMQAYIFNRGFRRALVKIGFSKDEAAKYLFHGWRHFYTSYMIKKLDKKLLKSQTGHRTDEMLAHYGNHETDGDREIIQVTSKETFAGLLPEREIIPENVLLLEYKGDHKTSAA
jgi:integrase